MADLRLWSREVITDFIELYKSHQCLWDVKCDGYKSKYVKSFAYKDLVQFCKKRGFPEANRDFVARKLQSLRGSFRKEMRKIEKYNQAGKSYQTNLWYFNNLLFTKDENADDEQNQTDDEGQSGDDCDNDDGDGDDETKYSVEVIPDAKPTTDPSSPPSPSPTPKRSKRSEMYVHPEFLDIGQETKFKDLKDLSEFELTGMNVAKKLARMNETQAIYAESLINSVVRKGLLNKLKEETDLCDSLCGRTRIDLPTQSFHN